MLLLLILHLGARNDAISASAYHRMLSWESRFSCCLVRFRNVKGPLYTLSTEPGNEGLAEESRPQWSFHNGVVSQYLNTRPAPKIEISYGSEMRGQIATMVATARTILFALGAKVYGDTSASEAFLNDSQRSVSFQGGVLTARFRVRGDTGFVGRYTISWKHDGDMPCRLSFVSPGAQISRALATDGGTWPVQIRQVVIKGKEHRTEVADLVVSAPTPLTKNERVLTPKPGDLVRDENLQIDYRQSQDDELDARGAATAIRHAMDGSPLDVKAERGLLCGPDCLYYLLRLCNRSVSERLILSLLPEVRYRGSSFSDLKDVGARFGLTLVGYHLKSDQLAQLTKPAILSCRPSHYLLYVPSQEQFVLIDPPYSVRTIRPRDLPILWTGDTLEVAGTR